jgi:hypothetical protein
MQLDTDITDNARIDVTVRRFCLNIVAVKKVANTTYSECVSVSLDIQHAMREYHVISDLSFSNLFFHIIS